MPQTSSGLSTSLVFLDLCSPAGADYGSLAPPPLLPLLGFLPWGLAPGSLQTQMLNCIRVYVTKTIKNKIFEVHRDLGLLFTVTHHLLQTRFFCNVCKSLANELL
ncbi:hypothetical protein KIL84_003875 [Mauremys mutica]|uniref:Secreted protein n=1 Tax=Mauremys mutica TaxID=74926 RepID=A0A9D3WWL4_9SAUR|nr:hypothetical protein KIL84_003875 [Mauremys mutica]